MIRPARLTGLALAAILLLPLVAGAQGITGTAHDLSGSGFTTEICVVCHTPHNADTTVTDAPLWNHELTAVVAYTLYSSATLDATLGQPTGISKLCLSCHDGTVAIDSFGGAAGGTFITDPNHLVGDASDLSEDHPISFTYDTALATADGELYDPSTALSSLGGTINDDMLFSGSLECASCHDVHGAAGYANFLRIDNTVGSALCLTCHNK